MHLIVYMLEHLFESIVSLMVVKKIILFVTIASGDFWPAEVSYYMRVLL